MSEELFEGSTENEGANIQEVAQPEIKNDIGVKEPVTAEPDKSFKEDPQNKAFAQIRREKEEFERKAKEAEERLNRANKWVTEKFGDTHGIKTWEEYQDTIQAQMLAAEKNVTVEDAKKEIERDKKVSELERFKQKYEMETLTLKQKAELKDKPFFKQLEPEIDALVEKSMSNGAPIDVNTAFVYLRGQNLERLMEQERSKTQKSTLADIQDKSRIKIDSGESKLDLDPFEILSADGMALTAAFGNDPKEIAKLVKSKKRS